MDTMVVLPTYNELENLRRVVEGLLAHDVGILIVDDASPDGTGMLADSLAANHPAVHVHHRERKGGLGRAYVEGFDIALARGASVICQMDADGSHDPAELPRLLDAVGNGAGLAIGSRFTRGGSAEMSMARRLLSRLGCWYARLMLRFPTKDSTSGYRAFTAEALRRIDPKTVTATGFAYQIEMAWRAHQEGIRIEEVPIHYRARAGGDSKLDSGTITEALLLVTRWGLRRKDRRARVRT